MDNRWRIDYDWVISLDRVSLLSVNNEELLVLVVIKQRVDIWIDLVTDCLVPLRGKSGNITSRVYAYSAVFLLLKGKYHAGC